MLLTDRKLVELPALVKMVNDENLRQLSKWGVQTHHPAEWLMYIMEELGELSQAISEHMYRIGSVEDVISEAIHVSTLSLKIAEMYSCPECWK